MSESISEGGICPLCQGAEVTVVKDKNRKSFSTTEEYMACRCVLVRDIRKNLNRAWTGLGTARARKLQCSPLQEHLQGNLWITAEGSRLRDHIKWVGARQSPNWYFRVVSDADLMAAWLVGLKIRDEAFDADVVMSLQKPIELEDLSRGPALLIIVLGIKAARNEAMPEVLQEALMLRAHDNRPTWVVDQPGSLYQFEHISFSDAVGGILSGWDRLSLTESSGDLRAEGPRKKAPRKRGPRARKQGVEIVEYVEEEEVEVEAPPATPKEVRVRPDRYYSMST